MGSEQKAACPENDALVEFMRNWWRAMAENKPKNYTENTERNIQRAFTSVCHHKTPIRTVKDFQQLKGVGKWFVKNMRGFFDSHSCAEDGVLLKEGEGKKAKGTRRYLPQKNSAAYALLITLYRKARNGIEFMRKQELIDAAEASGLARVPIAKGQSKLGLGSSSREWYSGWSSMSKLVDKGLVVKTSCPAKYKLSDAGREAARECLLRSDMLESTQNSVSGAEFPHSDNQDLETLEFVSADSAMEVTLTSADLNPKKGRLDDVPQEFLERFTRLGYTREQVLRVTTEVSTSSPCQEISSLWPTVLCRLREDEVYDFCFESQTSVSQQNLTSGMKESSSTSFRSPASSEICGASCSSSNYQVERPIQSSYKAIQNALRMPPLGLLENFEDAYEVVLILDDREHFTREKSRKFIENIRSEFKIKIEVRRLPVGDGLWIARHKRHQSEHVLDFIVERKNVDDLRSSIRDNRYKDQKLRLLRTGLKKIIYILEGDPNACEAADCIKTACFTTEILEGFDVQRTSGLGPTLRRYGHLTLAISDYYKLNASEDESTIAVPCPPYSEFISKCEEIDKMTVSDVFATLLMQVPQVTEEVAIAVLDSYPTLCSLASAYSLLDGDTCAQEELLMKCNKNVINVVASRNIFRFIWE